MDAHDWVMSVVDPDEEQEEEEELYGLEYARHYGLSMPYYEESLLAEGLPTPPHDESDKDPWGYSNASTIDAVNTLTKERLTVNKDAAILLKAVQDFREPPPEETLTLDSRKFARHVKQELPVLRTDNELDMLSFGKSSHPEFTKLNIPSEIINEENDEGLEWPRKYLRYPAQCEAQVKAEKLAVSRDVLLHLQDAIRDSYNSDDFEKLKGESVTYKPNTTRRSITPPLLPLSPILEPYIPSSPANHLPLLFDCSDSVATEAKSLELQILEADALSRKNSDSSDSMLLDAMHPPPFSPTFEKRTTTILKRRAEDLKVEGPLTPQTLSDSPMKKLKSVTFSEILHQFIPEVPWVTTTSDGDSPENDSYFDEAFREFESAREEVINKIEHEKLSGADTTARVDIPHVDFTPPVAPWNEYSQKRGDKHRPGNTELSAQMKFLRRVKLEDLKTATSWHGVSSLERQLSWNIFTTKITKINLDEQLHGETEFEKVLTELIASSIATSTAQVWKLNGLRILDVEDDEDEIEPAEMDKRKDMEALVCKRKIEMEEEASDVPRKRASPQPKRHTHAQPRTEGFESRYWNTEPPSAKVDTAVQSKPGQAHSQRPPIAQKARDKLLRAKDPVNDLMFGGFSATSALHKFMETRGRAVEEASAKTAQASEVTDRIKQHETILVVRSREPSSEHAVPSHQRQRGGGTIQSKDPRIASPPILPQLPTLPDNPAPCSFIVSTAFLQQRWLIKQIEQLYAKAEIVYRDYDLPHSPTKEADMLLSPSTGLVLTTLQQIKQRPLPGQVDRSPIKARIMALQQRLERLVVVVSEGLSCEMEQLGSSRPDDPRDKEALSHFEDFASRLEGEVAVKYVRGGQQGLAHAVVIEMVEYGLQHGSKDIGTLKPLAVETTWEIFLRRAGLNPFAAQIIVASLQKPMEVQFPIISSSPTSTGQFQAVTVNGLSAFIVMSEQERIKRFQALMGGSRILGAVGNALDQVWICASHGFEM